MEFRILGPLVVHDDEGRPIEMGAGRPRALLAALILHANEVVASDRLIDDLWGERPPRTAAKALQGYVSQIRRVLDRPGGGDGAILTRAPGYMLRFDPAALDSHRFEELLGQGRRSLSAGEAERGATTLREALDLWRGPALAEFGFQEFAQREIARLNELRLTCMEERIEADLALGRHADLVGELEALVGEHPLHERFRSQLMLALYRSGRQAEALREYQDARRVLVDELGLDPSEELQRMERAILTHDAELDLQPRARVTAPAAAVPSPVPDRGAGLLPQRAAGAIPPDSVVVLDPEGTRVVGYVPVGRRPVAVAVGHGSVWVANADDGTVSRVDPDTMGVARTIGIGGPPVDLAVGPDALWVATGSDGTVVRVDPDAEAVVETIDLRGSSDLVWNTTYALAVGSAGLWVAVGPRSLVRVDPATNETECTVDAGRVPVSIAIGAGTVWAVTIAGRALRIEPRTNGITAEATIAYPVDLAADDDAVWVADVYGRLWRIDPDTAATVFTTPVAAGPFSICSAGSGLWAADNGDGRVLRIDPEIGRVSAAVEIGHAPTDVAVGLDATWVTVQSDRAI